MGNICPWCCKNQDDTQSNDNAGINSAITSSQRSLSQNDATERTPLLKSVNNHPQSVAPLLLNSPIGDDFSNPHHHHHTDSSAPLLVAPYGNGDSTTVKPKLSSNETAETAAAAIFEQMLPDLIDVSGWGGRNNTTTTTTTGSDQHHGGTKISSTNINHINGRLHEDLTTSGKMLTNLQSIHIRQLLDKPSIRQPLLPEAGGSGLSSLLSARPVSSDVCHFVAHTAGELSRLLVDEIKIIHKEDLVVIFE